MSAPLSFSEGLLLSLPVLTGVSFVIATWNGRRGGRAVWLGAAALLCVLSFELLVTAGASALVDGVVSLPTTRGNDRPLVWWPIAWAYLLGLSILFSGALAGLVMSGSKRSYGPPLTLFLLAGYLLFAASSLIHSFRGFLGTLTTMAVLLAILKLQRRFGRSTALLAWIAVIVAAVFAYAVSA